MSKLDKFGVFILSNQRAGHVDTVKTLRRQGYTGDIYIVIDDKDPEGPEYMAEFGDKVMQFSKQESVKHFDIMDNFHDFRAVVYARNEIHRMASKLGLEYFLELDDDYNSFGIRFMEQGKLKQKTISNLDCMFEDMLDFLDESKALTIAFAQGGDYIGGDNSNWHKRLLRKSMNTFFCRTDRPFKFTGTINEDTNAYVDLGRRGELMLTVMDVCINQRETQANEGGLSTIYLDRGTYIKSFYTVMEQPSSVKVAMMGAGHYRLHHSVEWNATVPKILNQKYRRR